jgi:hypothetical protein
MLRALEGLSPYSIRYSAKNKNGYPKPSLAPDSAMMIFWSRGAMNLSANLPFTYHTLCAVSLNERRGLTIEFARTGSVGAMHAAIARAPS